MPDPPDEPWTGKLLRSLFCATPRKPELPGAAHPGHHRLTHVPGSNASFEAGPIGRADDFDAMRRHMAALDSEIAGLRRSLGHGARTSAGSVESPSMQPATPAASTTQRQQRGSEEDRQSGTQSEHPPRWVLGACKSQVWRGDQGSRGHGKALPWPDSEALRNRARGRRSESHV